MNRHNEIPMTLLPLKTFTFNKKDKTLSAFASDFGALRDTYSPRTGRTWLQRLYNDSCDIGIAIQSELTGKTERFYLT